jgi:hypothetical protein
MSGIIKTPEELEIASANIITQGIVDTCRSGGTQPLSIALAKSINVYHAAYRETYREVLALIDARVTDKYIIRKLRNHIRIHNV